MGQLPELDGFGKVCCTDLFGAGQISDGTGNAQQTMIGSGRQPKARDRLAKECLARRIGHGMGFKCFAIQSCIDAPLTLQCAVGGGYHPSPHSGRVFAGRRLRQIGRRKRRHFNTEVDAIE